jgi:serine/threonine protein kinase
VAAEPLLFWLGYVTYIGYVPPDRPGYPAITSLGVAVFLSVWWVAISVIAVGASRVIYGLRREVRKAQQLGQYVLGEKLGEGAMGQVFAAQHAMLRRPTALKLLKPEATDQSALRRFEREVRLTAGLTHPNTITVFDYGRTPDGVFYYAMELLDGATIEDVVHVSGPLDFSRVVWILRQAAGALTEAHGVGLIHRDIKPANLMLCKHAGQIDILKVLDFGLVKQVDAPDSVVLTQAGTITGTPLYMAPEVIRSAEAGDARSDLYALGAVAYYMITGSAPFTGESVVEVCAHHLHTAPTAPSERRAGGVPPALEALVLRCLAKEPSDRPQDAAALIRELEAMDASWGQEEARTWWARHGPELVPALEAPPSPSARTIVARA